MPSVREGRRLDAPRSRRRAEARSCSAWVTASTPFFLVIRCGDLLAALFQCNGRPWRLWCSSLLFDRPAQGVQFLQGKTQFAGARVERGHGGFQQEGTAQGVDRRFRRHRNGFARMKGDPLQARRACDSGPTGAAVPRSCSFLPLLPAQRRSKLSSAEESANSWFLSRRARPVKLT